MTTASFLPGLLTTICDDNNKNCKGAPFIMSDDWIKIFLARDPDYDVFTMSEDDFFSFLHMSQ